MSKYIVSARKYRPMRFDEVVGQNHVSNTLKNALKTDHLGHSFLFCGPRGVGKTTSARILAKVLNCEARTEDFEPCNTCASCTSFNQNQSFNIYELDAASNNSVDNIRDLVDQVRFPPQQGEYKVYIIDEVHMLSQAAFNAFLKTLEEPPHYAIFILATTEKHKILPTILSRCQIFDFNRVQVTDIVDHLKMISKQEGIDAEESALHIIAQKADGALRDSLSIFDRIVSFSGKELTYQQVTQSLKLLDYDTFFKMTDALLMQNQNDTLLLFDEILKNGFDGDQVMLGMAEHFRNLLVAKNSATLNLMEVAPNVKDRYQEQATLARQSFLLNALNIANQCDLTFKQAKNKRMHVELALLKICYLNQIEKGVPLEPASEIKKNASEKLDEKQETGDKRQETGEKRQETGDPKPVEKEPVESKKEPIVEEEPQINNEVKEPITEETETLESDAIIDDTPEEENQPNLKTSVASTKSTSPKPNIKPALSFHLSKLNEEVEKRKKETVEKKQPKEAEQEADFSENPEVSEEKVQLAWQSLAQKVNSASLAKGIEDSTVSYENGQLLITVRGKVIRDYLKEHHNLIVETIQSQTGLKKFSYEIECLEIDKSDIKSFTKEEELEYLKQNNPGVKKLCDDLNLQIRYD